MAFSSKSIALNVEFNAKDNLSAVADKVSGKLDNVAKKNADLSKAFKTIGITTAAIASALAAAGKVISDISIKYAELGDKILDTSKKMGLSAEEYQKLSLLSIKGDIEIEALAIGYKRLARNIALNTKEFQSLGIKSKDMMSVILELAEKVSKAGTYSEKAAIAFNAFGKNGTDLLPLLMKGKDAIAQLSTEAERYGYIVSAEVLEKNSQLSDSYNILKLQTQKLGMEFSATLQPVMQATIELFGEFLQQEEPIQRFFDGVKYGVITVAAVMFDIAKGFQYFLGFIKSYWLGIIKIVDTSITILTTPIRGLINLLHNVAKAFDFVFKTNISEKTQKLVNTVTDYTSGLLDEAITQLENSAEKNILAAQKLEEKKQEFIEKSLQVSPPKKGEETDYVATIEDTTTAAVNGEKEKMKAIKETNKELEKQQESMIQLNEIYASAGEVIANTFKMVKGEMDFSDYWRSFAKMGFEAIARVLEAFADKYIAEAAAALAASGGIDWVHFALSSSAAAILEGAAATIRNLPVGFAQGGIVTKPVYGMIGETGEPEAVIPLSKLRDVIKSLNYNSGNNFSGNVYIYSPIEDHSFWRSRIKNNVGREYDNYHAFKTRTFTIG